MQLVSSKSKKTMPDSAEWRQVTEHLADITSWKAPTFPLPKDPGPFEGSPAAGEL